jgi:uncharacterized SAM-binding protein YcdF (DUF218 family)
LNVADLSQSPYPEPGFSPARSTRWPVLGLRLSLAAALLVAGLRFASGPLLTTLGSFLVVEDAPQPSAAILVLDGGAPFREREAARLYGEGWAPRLVITRGADAPVTRAQILEHLGVPRTAIEVIDERPSGTLEELDLLASAVGQPDAPVMLVTSAYHTRRVGLAWSQATEGQVRGIVRAARQEPFDPHIWWRDAEDRVRVWHEYVGLAAYTAHLGYT